MKTGMFDIFTRFATDLTVGKRRRQTCFISWPDASRELCDTAKTGISINRPTSAGMEPRRKTLSINVEAISVLLKGRTVFSAVDYREILGKVEPGDLVYMDPPYQGVSHARDNRYYSGVPFDEFVDAVRSLNRKGVAYLISYDGECGQKEYGRELPDSLRCHKILLNAGLSSQSVLLGKRSTTFEALYISEELMPVFPARAEPLPLFEAIV